MSAAAAAKKPTPAMLALLALVRSGQREFGNRIFARYRLRVATLIAARDRGLLVHIASDCDGSNAAWYDLTPAGLAALEGA